MELWSQGETSTGADGQKKSQGKGGRSGGQEPKKKGYVQATESTVAAVEQGKGKKKNPGQAQGSGTSGGKSGSGQKPPCFFCGQPHHMRNCPEWQEARAALKKEKQGNA